MSTLRAPEAPSFHRIDRSAFDQLEQLDLTHTTPFLEPLQAILDFVRNRPAHCLVAIRSDGALAGFYVVHPDRRDAACWWLGWLAIDRTRQGTGLGRAALAAALARLARLDRCRRVRLLVAAANPAARRLYAAAGFRVVGTWPPTGELVMERPPPATPPPRPPTPSSSRPSPSSWPCSCAYGAAASPPPPE